MESLVSIFHVDYKLLIAQIVNFAIVFSILYFLIFKPLVKTMADRNSTIEKGLKDADEAREKIQKVNLEAESIISEAKKEAFLILSGSQKAAEEKRVQIVEKAKDDIRSVIDEEKALIKREKDRMIEEIREEAVSLTIMATEKMLQEKLDKNKDGVLIKTYLA